MTVTVSASLLRPFDLDEPQPAGGRVPALDVVAELVELAVGRLEAGPRSVSITTSRAHAATARVSSGRSTLGRLARRPRAPQRDPGRLPRRTARRRRAAASASMAVAAACFPREARRAVAPSGGIFGVAGA